MSRVLSDAAREFMATARTATLATISPDGHPRLVPICFVVIDDVVWTPLDEKPKRVSEVRDLARVRDIERDSRVTVLFDRWSEDWPELAWLRLEGRARVVASDPTAVAALRAKYPQYADHDLESRPMITIIIAGANPWGAINSSR
jgi:PPOX class probable F420-dependent enzyme